ncbi:MAG: hypothetical protein DI579_07015 [Lawsonella clevelandensis]|uniref:Uncharacterized protein n=1 Tax=Lawsonella clevelandensis TaxID=1528099 RepID=A0A2W5I7Z8_9ACTN|nr:MAG: hypothetical protein DI579_07015 [Lawsonella clevelandensis]
MFCIAAVVIAIGLLSVWQYSILFTIVVFILIGPYCVPQLLENISTGMVLVLYGRSTIAMLARFMPIRVIEIGTTWS